MVTLGTCQWHDSVRGGQTRDFRETAKDTTPTTCAAPLLKHGLTAHARTIGFTAGPPVDYFTTSYSELLSVNPQVPTPHHGSTCGLATQPTPPAIRAPTPRLTHTGKRARDLRRLEPGACRSQYNRVVFASFLPLLTCQYLILHYTHSNDQFRTSSYKLLVFVWDAQPILLTSSVHVWTNIVSNPSSRTWNISVRTKNHLLFVWTMGHR